jgi:hypothetical protein
MAIAKPRVVVHQISFRRPIRAVMELPFAETLAAPISGAIHQNDHAQSGVVVPWQVGYLVEKPAKPFKTGHFR